MNESAAKILVVDDEPGNIFLLKRLLGYKGYEVLTADNGIDAIDIMYDEHPDVVLLDIMMPEVTGIDVLKKVVNDDRTKDIPIIMCTAKTAPEDVEHCLEMGAVEYVKKPIEEVELLARLRTVLRIKKHEDTLKQMIKSKEDFVRTVAHDLRTPFTSISGFAEILKGDDLLIKSYSEEHVELLNYIIDSSNFIVDYFNKLLFWAQGDSGSLNISKSNISLVKLVETSVVMFKSKSELKNINIETQIDESITVNIDATYFGQVINNLLGNALKYTPQGGKIMLQATKEKSGVTFIVKDTGTGMSPELIEKVLTDQKISSTPGTNKEKGTGLGLQICKRIIREHEFNFNIESVPDKGTSMIIEIKDTV